MVLIFDFPGIFLPTLSLVNKESFALKWCLCSSSYIVKLQKHILCNIIIMQMAVGWYLNKMCYVCVYHSIICKVCPNYDVL